MANIRKQLSLYAPEPAAIPVEEIRRVVDPVQHRLIPAHVTLCREDELTDLERITDTLRGNSFAPVTLRFGKAEFFDGHGLILHCVEGETGFRALREALLGSADIRNQRPHLTLAHPRNPKAPGNALANTAGLPTPFSITFPTVFLIRQTGRQPWEILDRFPLRGGPATSR